MKIKTGLAIVMVAIFISASASTASKTDSLDGDDGGPDLKVEVKVVRLFQRWYLIQTTVKNLEDERITLTTARPAGGIRVTANIWEVIYQKPGAIIMLAYPLSLRPHQKKIISIGLCNMEWYPSAYVYIISGYLSSYEYEGKTYPYTWGNRIVIWGEVSQ